MPKRAISDFLEKSSHSIIITFRITCAMLVYDGKCPLKAKSRSKSGISEPERTRIIWEVKGLFQSLFFKKK
jgi:hypothetical protein